MSIFAFNIKRWRQGDKEEEEDKWPIVIISVNDEYVLYFGHIIILFMIHFITYDEFNAIQSTFKCIFQIKYKLNPNAI